MLADEAGQLAGRLRQGLARWRGRVAVDQKVVGEHDAVARRHRLHLVTTVGIERDEREPALRRSVGDGLAGVFDHESATLVRGRKRHDQRADHRVVLLGVLMGDEELPAPIDQHGMELRAEIAARRQSEIPAQLIENGVERPGPAPLVDLHAAQGNFLRVTDFAVQKRLLAPPELGRAAQQVQVLGLGLGHWQAQRSHPPHLQAEIVGWRGPLGAEGTSDGDLSEADGQPVACRDRHGAHSSVRYLPGVARL